MKQIKLNNDVLNEQCNRLGILVKYNLCKYSNQRITDLLWKLDLVEVSKVSSPFSV